MSFSYQNWSVGSLLTGNKRTLKIPRYQRDFSWEEKETLEFMEDILKGLYIEENKVKTSQYFFGTALLSGDNSIYGGELEIIDGQQRITTMTIFLSALSKAFDNADKKALGKKVWEYVIGETDDEEKYKILVTDTRDDYFEYSIQSKEQHDKLPVDEEQDRILDAYRLFEKNLTEEKIRKKLKKVHKSNIFKDIDYIDILKGIREQLISSTIICIITTDKKESNTIFEVLNGRGKKLDPIDLIKNAVFKELNIVQPTDHAYNVWNNIKDNLVNDEESIEFTVFFNHYWKCKYKNSTENEIYNDFMSIVSKDDYKMFIEDMQYMSKIYMKLVFPKNLNFTERENYYIKEHLNYFNNTLDVSQVRIALMALFDARFRDKFTRGEKESILSGKKFKETLTYLHQFHFAYIGLCGKRASILTTIFGNFSKSVFKSNSKREVNNAIDKLKIELEKIYPSYSEFKKIFIGLEFTKVDINKKISKKIKKNNMLSKYVLYNIEKYYSKEDTEKRDGSVEHILSEDKSNPITLNIGNLILIESSINSNLRDLEFDKKIEGYKESKYSFVEKFRNEYNETNIFNEGKIIKRASEMAEIFYYDILGRPRSKN